MRAVSKLCANRQFSPCRVAGAMIVAAVLAASTLASAQVPAPAGAPAVASSPNPATGDVNGVARNPKKDVPVPQKKTDEMITDRLIKIFNLTGWFQNLKVVAEDGIVTLSGTVGDASERDWAIGLAKDTEGVVAVINKLDLKQLGWFDVTPAKNELEGFARSTFTFIPYLVLALLMFGVSAFLFYFVARSTRKLWARRITNPVLSDVAAKAGALPVLLIGVYLILQVLGLTGLAVTILGGTGAIGLVAGFAFKSILENYFSGIMLSMRRPFIIGDVVEVAGTKGVVFSMTTSGTTLVDFEGNHVLIPNTLVLGNIIKNESVSALTKLNMAFEVSDRASAAELKKIAQDVVGQEAEILKSPESRVSVDASQTRSGRTTVELRFWIDLQKTNAEKIKQTLLTKFRDRIAAALPEENVVESSQVQTGSDRKAEASALLNHARSKSDSADARKNEGRNLL